MPDFVLQPRRLCSGTSRTNIHVVNPDGVEKGVREIIADGRKVDAQPVIPAGNICNAEIIMG